MCNPRFPPRADGTPIRLACLALLLALSLAACDAKDEGAGCTGAVSLDGVSYPSREVRIRPAHGRAKALCAFIADTDQRRTHGLMRVTDLGDRAGMVFIFDGAITGRFWMRNTPMPLSIAWFGADGAFVSSSDMAPCGDSDDCPRYPAAAAFRYALEVPQGRLGDHGVGPGARLDLAEG